MNRFNNEFWNNLTKPLAWEVAMRVRVTKGWNKKIYGNYHFKTSDLMTTGPIDEYGLLALIVLGNTLSM